MYKNYEGYSDPTAGKAIKKAGKKTGKKKRERLAYSIGEIEAFKDLKIQMDGK